MAQLSEYFSEPKLSQKPRNPGGENPFPFGTVRKPFIPNNPKQKSVLSTPIYLQMIEGYCTNFNFKRNDLP